MATYPGGVAAFSTHNNGDVLQPQDINNPNAEIVAIETALLNGFQHALKPLTDNVFDLGDSSHAWKNLWTKGTVQLNGVTYTFPAADGSANQVLQTNGSKVLAWATAGPSLPVSVANGGTGDSSLTAHGVLVGEGTSPVTALAVGTTNQVLVGASGADPAFATIASSILSDLTNWTSWTPTDQSGASLSFTLGTCKYWQLGKLVLGYADLTYPSTASGAAAKFSLPVTPLSGVTSFGGFFTHNPTSRTLSIEISGGVATILDNNAVAQTNANMTTDRMCVTLIYQAN